MINMDQVRTLELKVKQAVQLIVHLRRENDQLRTRLSDTEVRLQDLEALLGNLKASQTEMELGIKSALEELDQLEGQEQASSSRPGPVESIAAIESDEVKNETETEISSVSSDSFPEHEPVSDEFSPENDVYSEAETTQTLELSVETEAEGLFDQEESTPETAPQDREQPGLGIF